jgi:hypothetical protein
MERGWFALRVLVAIAAAASLSGCASISHKFAETASEMPAIGLPANAPERPAETPVFPAVHDIPPPRNSVVLSDFEQRKMEDDLVAARNEQQTALGVRTETKKTDTKKTAAKSKVVPVSASRTIY